MRGREERRGEVRRGIGKVGLRIHFSRPSLSRPRDVWTYVGAGRYVSPQRGAACAAVPFRGGPAKRDSAHANSCI